MAPTDRVFIIAEAGINHCGKWTRALDLCDAAKFAGADAVKFQIYHAERMLHGDRVLLTQHQLQDQAHEAIKAHCDEIDIEWFASCFDEQAVDLCMRVGARRIKVGSGEITNRPLLEYIGETSKPMILSTGMSDLNDVFRATGWFRFDSQTGKERLGADKRFSLLHCVSNYPTEPEHCNLRALETLKRNFFCPVGFSDHTVGTDAAIAAVALGAKIIEKHIALDFDAPDARVSLDAEQFRFFVDTIRQAEQMLGDGIKILQPGEKEMQKHVRNRWYVSADRAA